MTEPREPEAVPESEPAPQVQPTIPTSPSPGNWYPVSAQPEPEPEAPAVPEEAAAEPEAATVPEEPGAEAAEQPESEPEAAPEPLVEPEPRVEPVETPEQASASATTEADANEDPTVSLSGPEFAAPAAAAATRQLDIPDDPTSGSTAPADGIFRQPSPPSPVAEPTTVEPLSEEEQKLAAERAARRDARAAALAAPAPEPVAPPKPVVIHKRTNDRFWGSLGLFLLRVVLAGIFTIRGLNILTDIPAAQAEFAKTILADYPPGPQVVAIVTGVASLLIALSLLLGLLTRIAGLGIALIAGGALVLVYWGPWSPFVAGQPGFLGEYQLLLTATGILLICIGGGGWSLDRSFRAGRERDKRERAAEAE